MSTPNLSQGGADAIRRAQIRAANVLIRLYTETGLTPLHLIIDDVRPRLIGQVPEHAGDEEHRRAVLADYAAPIGADLYIQGEALCADGTYHGVPVELFTPIEASEEES